MKTRIIAVLLLCFAASAFAVEKAELEERIYKLTRKLEELQATPDKRIPVDKLRQARGIILLERIKVGIVFGYQGGGGVAMVKDPATQKWSPPAFMSAHEGSFGAQIGGEKNFIVVLLMSTNATRLLIEPKTDFRGEARGTAGDASGGEEAKSVTPEQTVLVFDSRKGFYGGATIKGGSVSPDEEASRTYYQQYVTTKEILFENKVQPTEAARVLANKVTELSKNAEK